MQAWILLSGLCVMLSGCANATYVKAGATDADFVNDKAECTQQMLMSPSGANLAAAESAGPYEKAITTPAANATARQGVEQCLELKGWILKSPPQ